ncbi:MAG: hypothetical protein H5T59_07480, partial [Anaerolineae bacterium]|nr:hypothetical protein [Anaerolineae bacterium]
MSAHRPPDVTAWLLQAATPTIRALTLQHLLGHSPESPAVQEARRVIMQEGPVPAILAEQEGPGYWISDRSYYSPKYRSTHWSMLLLVEHQADSADGRVRRGAAYMLQATAAEIAEWLREGRRGLSCFWGNLLRYALHAGLHERPEVALIAQFLVRDALEGTWECRHNWDLPCAWGAVRGLWGLAALPAARKGPDVQQAVQRGIAFLLEEHRLHPPDYPPADQVSRLWRSVNFPLFYQVDTLFVLRVLDEVGALAHPGAGAA